MTTFIEAQSDGQLCDVEREPVTVDDPFCEPGAMAVGALRDIGVKPSRELDWANPSRELETTDPPRELGVADPLCKLRTVGPREVGAMDPARKPVAGDIPRVIDPP